MSKFSYTEEEIKILKNFAEIHSGMIIKPDNFMVVNGMDKSVVGVYKFENPYDYDEYGIYDLKEFLSGIGLYESELEIHEKYVSISNTKQGIQTKYRNTSLDMLPEVKDLSEKMSQIDCELEFSLTAEKYNVLKKIIQVYGADRLYFRALDNKSIRLVAGWKLQSDSFDPELQENATEIIFKDDEVQSANLPDDTVLYIKVDEFKLMEGDYNVKISSKGISNWKHQHIQTLQYFIGIANIQED